MEQSVKKKSNSSAKEDPLSYRVKELRDLLKHLKDRGLPQKDLLDVLESHIKDVPAIITDKRSMNVLENAIKDVPDNDGHVLKARLKHAHATLCSPYPALFQLGHERDLGYLFRYLPVYSCGVSTAGDNLPDHTVCSRFANVKDVRESIEWDTRVQECGGKIGFRTHNDGDDVSVNLWTWGLRGYVAVHFDRLVEVFGEPRHCSGPYMKVDWEWHIEFEDGTSGRIYNWKNGPNSLGPAGLNKYEIGTGKYVGVYGADDWHVGGKSPLVVSHVENALNFS